MRRYAAGIGVLLLVANGCALARDRDGSPRADTAPTRGGTLRVAVSDDDASTIELDPRSYGVDDWELARCCLLRTLYSYNGRPTDQGGTEPRLDLAAGSPEVSSDGLTWTFRLKEGIHYAPPFADREIVVGDIVEALEREGRLAAPDEDYSYYYSVIRGFDDFVAGTSDSIVGLETPDSHTLVVRLREVSGDLAYRFSLPATAPIPEGAAAGHDTDYGRFLVASGPYMIEGSEDLDFSVPPDQQQPAIGFVPPTLAKHGVVEDAGSLVLVRNPSWDPAADPLRPAFPDRIEVAIGGGDEEVLARRVDASETDLVFALGGSPFEQVVRYRDDPALEDRLYEHPADAGWAVTMNLAVPPFDDVHVRRAVSRAIDKERLVGLLAEPPHGPAGFQTGEVATHMAPDTFEAGLLRAFDPYPYDPAAARVEMRASAYDRDGDGRCDAPACRGVRALVLDEGVIPEQARAIFSDLGEIGIELDLQVESKGPFFNAFDRRAQVPMVIAFPWGKDYPEGAGWFPIQFDRSGLGNGANTSLLGANPDELRAWGYRVTSVPSVDDRIQACLERRGVTRTECWAELDQYLSTEVVPRVPYMFMDHAQVVSERVVAYSFDQFGGLPALDRIALAPGSE